MSFLTKALFSVFFALLVITKPVAAENDEPSPEGNKTEAEIRAVIDACWAVSEEHRNSPNVDTMNQGHELSANCLLKKIYKIARPLYENDDDFLKYYAEPLERTYRGLFDLLFGLNQKNKFCPSKCGTIETNIIYNQLAFFYADIYRQSYLKNKRYIH